MSEVINALKGVVVALISSLLMAILFAWLFRLPIPMVGYIGPFGEFSTYGIGVIETVKSVLIAWVFYGLFGGFIVLALCGAIAGALVGRKYSGSSNKNKMILLWSATISVVPVFALSILDYIIGPW